MLIPIEDVERLLAKVVAFFMSLRPPLLNFPKSNQLSTVNYQL